MHEPSAYPFVFLDPEFDEVGKWWRSKLKKLIDLFGQEALSKAILNITYFPYPSQRFAHRKLRIPSQKYTFHLVSEAVKRNTVIVLMRKKAKWLDAVPELRGYDCLYCVRNTQTPSISPRNCDNFDKIVRAIETTS
jgi:hypothetical protein